MTDEKTLEELQQRHADAYIVCKAILKKIYQDGKDSDSVVSMLDIETIGIELIGDKAEHLLPFFEKIFEDLDYIEVRKIEEVQMYHKVNLGVYEDKILMRHA